MRISSLGASLVLGLVLLGTEGSAQIDRAPPLPTDTPMRMRAIEAVCTGIGAEARNDPRWATYPLRIEVVGAAGEFLGAAQVTVMSGDEALASVNCNGPWVLFRLPQGAYNVMAEIAGTTRTGRVNVGSAGQARVILRFPSDTPQSR